MVFDIVYLKVINILHCMATGRCVGGGQVGNSSR